MSKLLRKKGDKSTKRPQAEGGEEFVMVEARMLPRSMKDDESSSSWEDLTDFFPGKRKPPTPRPLKKNRRPTVHKVRKGIHLTLPDFPPELWRIYVASNSDVDEEDARIAMQPSLTKEKMEELRMAMEDDFTLEVKGGVKDAKVKNFSDNLEEDLFIAMNEGLAETPKEELFSVAENEANEEFKIQKITKEQLKLKSKTPNRERKRHGSGK